MVHQVQQPRFQTSIEELYLRNPIRNRSEIARLVEYVWLGLATLNANVPVIIIKPLAA